LPEGWTVLNVEENTYPTDLPKGNGKAIFLGRRPGKEARIIVYIMPADYQDGGPHPRSLSGTIPAKLIATVSTAKIYLWEQDGQLSAPGWLGMWDDIPKGLLTQE
jgi:hypothetical protein